MSIVALRGRASLWEVSTGGVCVMRVWLRGSRQAAGTGWRRRAARDHEVPDGPEGRTPQMQGKFRAGFEASLRSGRNPKIAGRVRLRRRPWNGDDGMEVIQAGTVADRNGTPSPGVQAGWGGVACHRCRAGHLACKASERQAGGPLYGPTLSAPMRWDRRQSHRRPQAVRSQIPGSIFPGGGRTAVSE